MARTPRIRANLWLGVALLGMVPAGCRQHDVAVRTTPAASSSPPREQESLRSVSYQEQAAVPKPLSDSSPLSFEQLLAIAAEQNPDLGVARARAEAARGLLIQAGLYPNPLVSWAASDLGDPINGGGNQGPSVTQVIVTGGKLRLAREAASQGVASMDWQAVTRWYEVLTRVRLALCEVLTAQGEVEVNREVVRLSEVNLDAARKLQRAGAGTQPDILQAQVELDQNRVRLGVAEQRANAAWKLLAIAIGTPELPPRPLAESLAQPVPHFEWQPVLDTVLARSSEAQAAHANVLQAEALVQRARAEVIPDLRLAVRPFYAFPDRNLQAGAEIGVVVPIFNRNEGNVAAALGDLARTQHEVRQIVLSLTQRLTLAFQRYAAARQQTQVYEKTILPNANESLRLVRLGYESGDPKYDYTALLQVQRTVAQARLAYVQALGDVWRAASEIAGLLQEDQFASKP